MEHTSIKIALLDLNNGYPNQAMGCFRKITDAFGAQYGINIIRDEFDVRGKGAVPDLSYDIYISSGGPGSPFEGVGTDWEARYFKWLGDIYEYNKQAPAPDKKFVFLICHSFQLASRYFGIGQVCLRKSASFGVMPVHRTFCGRKEPVFEGLPEPFFVVENRNWQVIQPDNERLAELGARILVLEKKRPNVPLERAIMSIRFSSEMIGTQFHPEADAAGMRQYLLQPEKKAQVIRDHGIEKYENMMAQLEDKDKISLTQSVILPSFLRLAYETVKQMPLVQPME